MTQGRRVIAISGGSGSGKTTVVDRMKSCIDASQVLVLSLDHYYYDLSHLTAEERATRNFDHPSAFDQALLHTHLTDLLRGKSIARPTYDFATHTRTGETVDLRSHPVILVDGIFALHDEALRRLYDMGVYIEVSDDVRFIRRLGRDMRERGRSLDSVVNQYLATVKPMHDTYVAPQKRVADIIISWEQYNDRAIAMLAGLVRTWLGDFLSHQSLNP